MGGRKESGIDGFERERLLLRHGRNPELLFRRLRGRDQARAVLRRNPNPQERKKAQSEARAARTKAGLKYGVKSSK